MGNVRRWKRSSISWYWSSIYALGLDTSCLPRSRTPSTQHRTVSPLPLRSKSRRGRKRETHVSVSRISWTGIHITSSASTTRPLACGAGRYHHRNHRSRPICGSSARSITGVIERQERLRNSELHAAQWEKWAAIYQEGLIRRLLIIPPHAGSDNSLISLCDSRICKSLYHRSPLEGES